MGWNWGKILGLKQQGSYLKRWNLRQVYCAFLQLLTIAVFAIYSSLVLAQNNEDQNTSSGAPTGAPTTTIDKTDPTVETDTIDDIPIPEIITDLNALPFPTRKMRDLIIAAARTGDIEKLRPYLGYGDDVTMLSLGGFDGDPIEFLKSLSGDADGHEILAIITEVLEAPPAKSEAIAGEVIYIWPYFYSYPFDKLTDAQRVQMYRIITHGDFEEMIQYGSYIFFRLGITPEGRWQFFVAGD